MGFQVNYFTLPSHYEETPLCDRKANLPNLYQDEEKAEFLRDVIALANSARSFGKPARLLFGIDNDGEPCDLSKYLAPYAHHLSADIQLPEKIREMIGKTLASYVTPELSRFDFELGECEGKRVAYLLIYPVAAPKRFRVRRNLTSGKQSLLYEGQSWIRFGEHKQEVTNKLIEPDSSAEPYHDSYAEIPYVLPSCWLAYFNWLLADQQITKAHTIVGYQEPQSSAGVPMRDEVERFLESEKRMLIIEGLAGVGKTAFLCRQVGRLAENNAVAMEEMQRREEFHGPPDWTPLWFPLRGSTARDEEQLTKHLLNAAHKSQAFWTGNRPRHPEHLLEYSDLRWLICLDGLDEIWSDQQQRAFLGALRAFLTRFPRVKVILTTRPEAVCRDEAWLEAQTVHMAPLSREMVLNYIDSQLKEESSGEYHQEIVSVLSSNDDLWHLCSFPVCLEAAMKELADVHPEPLPEVTAQAGTAIEPSEVTREEVSSSAEPSAEAIQIPEPVLAEDLMPAESLDLKTSEPSRDEEEPPPPPIRPELVLDGMYRRLREREQKRDLLPARHVEKWWDRAGKLALKLDGHSGHCDFDMARKTLGSWQGLNWLLNLGVLDRLTERQALTYRTEATKVYFAASYLWPRVTTTLDAGARRSLRSATPGFRMRVRSMLETLSTDDFSSLIL